MKTIALLLGVHAHQPVGNFDAVLEDAHQRSYKPFLETFMLIRTSNSLCIFPAGYWIAYESVIRNFRES